MARPFTAQSILGRGNTCGDTSSRECHAEIDRVPAVPVEVDSPLRRRTTLLDRLRIYLAILDVKADVPGHNSYLHFVCMRLMMIVAIQANKPTLVSFHFDATTLKPSSKKQIAPNTRSSRIKTSITLGSNHVNHPQWRYHGHPIGIGMPDLVFCQCEWNGWYGAM